MMGIFLTFSKISAILTTTKKQKLRNSRFPAQSALVYQRRKFFRLKATDVSKTKAFQRVFTEILLEDH